MEKCSAYSDIGERQENQDAILARAFSWGELFIVADGLGGYSGGAIASNIATKEISEALVRLEAPIANMEKAIALANTAIIDQQKDDISTMKTTVAVACVTEKMAYFANVGDTRIYAFRNGEIIFQSVDHSVSQIAVRMGEITKEQIRYHESRNRLTRAVGSLADLKVQTYSLLREDFDALLICSDGFWEDVTELDMCEALRDAGSAHIWLERMKEKIKKRKRHDNHSALSVFYKR